ncbi:MAG: succinylglutamate desuccinylase/aspartoacylase family protein [Salinicola sp.]|uniref:succinylglutamate desuccinylase/aspartoacylase family protein n=1 Tax=Salinicola sp. TaxID=1978524 RepID=UPI001DA4DFA4|nr:succinylglutamate desuccinylase/aspartoacylase family protein [Salinicola sp.]NRB55992.1 succinylglutamate desuccinylase/aspartoacylase family protein [Salinicola sp.]
MSNAETNTPTLITTQIDFDRDGVQHGSLQVPYSRDRSAYGHIPIPITVIRRGGGPRVLLTGGNHGDEYEGPVALIKLVQRLKDESVRGTLIVIPSLNLPAVLNASRTSPIDGGNLNRLFPGRRDGSITEMIAHYVEHELFPRVDGAIDLHAGGASFDHLPTLLTFPPADAGTSGDYLALIEAFSAPRAMALDMLGEDRTYSSAAARAGIWFLGGELGGGSRCDPDCLEIVESGLARVLHRLGMIAVAPPSASRKTQWLAVQGHSHYLFTPRPGMFEPCFRLGETVTEGQLAGRLYDPYEPWQPPRELYVESDGIVVCARTFAGVDAGDCLCVLAAEVDKSLIE